MQSVCPCVCESPDQHLNAWTTLHETLYIYIYIYQGNWTLLDGVFHKFLQSVWVSVYVFSCRCKETTGFYCIPPFDTRQRLGKHVPATMNKRNKIRIVGCVIFYAVHVLSKKSLWIFLCIPLPLLGNGSVSMFPAPHLSWNILLHNFR
jgi:hypothetical protein